MKRLAPKHFDKVAEFCYQSWFAVLPPDIEYEDLFDPVVWSNFRTKFQQHDLVRVRSENGSYDVQLVVEHVTTGGINMKVWPHFRASTGMAALQAAEDAAGSAEKRVVPLGKDGEPVVRVRHLPATNWRLIGLNGDEVNRNHKSKPIALEALKIYLDQVNHVLPEPFATDWFKDETDLVPVEPVETAVETVVEVAEAKAPEPPAEKPAEKPAKSATKKSATKRAA